MERQSEKEEDVIVVEIEKLISEWETNEKQSKKIKPQKLVHDLKTQSK